MPANPERMRPTVLSNAPIMFEVNTVVLEAALAIREETEQQKAKTKKILEKDHTNYQLRIIDLFIKNTVVDRYFDAQGNILEKPVERGD